MFKKLALLSVVLSLGACETINQVNQCEPEKNYVRTNNQAMDRYKIASAAGEIKSFYFEEVIPTPCYNDLCVRYNTEKLIFLERNFDDKKRHGVYTVRAIEGSENSNCIEKDASSLNNKKQLCYTLEKNENNLIKSQYKYVFDASKKGQTIISFIDMKNNIELYQSSYQTYSTGAIGGPGRSTCKSNKTSDYSFNIMSFPKQN